MKSIVQPNKDRCYLCGMSNGESLDEHHVFAGTRRGLSEKYGLKVYLHHSTCHIFGKNAVHRSAETDFIVKRNVQQIAMKHYGWSVEDFIAIFGKNYL